MDSRSTRQSLFSFFGAIRCFNTGFNFGADPRVHKLWLDLEVDRLEASKRNGFSEAAARHVFARVTASFEALPLTTPRVLRRNSEVRAVVTSESQSVDSRSATAESQDLQTALEPGSASEQAALYEAEVAQRDRLILELMQNIRSEALSRAAYEQRSESELQSLRAENAETTRSLREEQELRTEYERENVILESQLAVYTGKSRSGDETLASRFLSAFASALGSAQNFIDSQAALEKESAATAAELELLRDQLAEARAQRYALSARVQGLEVAQNEISGQAPSFSLMIGDSDSLEEFFFANPESSSRTPHEDRLRRLHSGTVRACNLR